MYAIVPVWCLLPPYIFEPGCLTLTPNCVIFQRRKLKAVADSPRCIDSAFTEEAATHAQFFLKPLSGFLFLVNGFLLPAFYRGLWAHPFGRVYVLS